MSLSPAQLEALRSALHELRGQLQRVVEASAGGAAPVDLDEPIGRVSRIDALRQQHMVQAHRRASQQRLQQVDAALRRLDDGEYGVCLDCGEPVGFGRLEVRPETPFCIGCQSQQEARG